MRNYWKLIFLSPIAFSCLGCEKQEEKVETKTPVDVVVISGQSNGVGCTNSNCIGIDNYFEYKNGYQDMQIAFDCWTKDVNPTRYYSQNSSIYDGFEYVKLGQGNSKNTFGPEIGIAQAMHQKYGGKLFLIKFACGASNLQDDWAKPNSPMYGKFISYVKKQVNNLKQMGYDPTIKAFCWMQGEGDSYDGYYQNYYNNLKQFVSNVRGDLNEFSGNKTIPFIDAGISNAEPWVYYKEVNAAKKQFSLEGENNIYIDTIEAGLHTNLEPADNPDLCHYDSESEIELGKLFAESFEQFLQQKN